MKKKYNAPTIRNIITITRADILNIPLSDSDADPHEEVGAREERVFDSGTSSTTQKSLWDEQW